MGLHWIEPINYLLRFDVHQKLHDQIGYTERRKINLVVSLGLVYFIQNFNTRNKFDALYVRVCVELMLLLILYRNVLHASVDCIGLYSTNAAYVGIELSILTLHKRNKVVPVLN
jgi:hypothetical protein